MIARALVCIALASLAISLIACALAFAITAQPRHHRRKKDHP